MATIWVLVFLVFSNGHAAMGGRPFATQKECEAAKAAVTAEALKEGFDTGGFVCAPVQPGKLA